MKFMFEEAENCEKIVEDFMLYTGYFEYGFKVLGKKHWLNKTRYEMWMNQKIHYILSINKKRHYSDIVFVRELLHIWYKYNMKIGEYVLKCNKIYCYFL